MFVKDAFMHTYLLAYFMGFCSSNIAKCSKCKWCFMQTYLLAYLLYGSLLLKYNRMLQIYQNSINRIRMPPMFLKTSTCPQILASKSSLMALCIWWTYGIYGIDDYLVLPSLNAPVHTYLLTYLLTICDGFMALCLWWTYGIYWMALYICWTYGMYGIPEYLVLPGFNAPMHT